MRKAANMKTEMMVILAGTTEKASGDLGVQDK